MLLAPLFKIMAEKQASDLFVTCGAPIQMKINGVIQPVNDQVIKPDHAKRIAYEFMSPAQIEEYEKKREMNLSYIDPAIGNFRVNIFFQRHTNAVVIRHVKNQVPPFDSLRLPPVLLDLVMEKRGLILVVGSTGSGKSTSLAAMIDHRNANRAGHILTIEDPVEYLFRHKKSIVNQREVHVDTLSYHNALMSAMREAPDLVMVGEIRDRETFQQALILALSGHVCLSTLHANNSYHALSRIINMFPHDARSGLLSDLAYALRAIISQRLIKAKDGALVPAVEILLNSFHIAELIEKGELSEIKDAMEKSLYPGSQTFEQALCKLYLDGTISYEEALTNSDSPTNLSWLINQTNAAPTGKDGSASGKAAAAAAAAAAHAANTGDFTGFTIDTNLLNRR